MEVNFIIKTRVIWIQQANQQKVKKHSTEHKIRYIVCQASTHLRLISDFTISVAMSLNHPPINDSFERFRSLTKADIWDIVRLKKRLIQLMRTNN